MSEMKAMVVENHPNDSRVKIREDGICQSLTGRMGTGGVMYRSYSPTARSEGRRTKPTSRLGKRAMYPTPSICLMGGCKSNDIGGDG